MKNISHCIFENEFDIVCVRIFFSPVGDVNNELNVPLLRIYLPLVYLWTIKWQ